MAKIRAFISFDYNDVRYRDFLVGQARNPISPIEIDDWSLKEAFYEKWKTQCRERIKKADIVIQLVGKNTHNVGGAIWEVKCAKNEGIPVFGVYIDKDQKGEIPRSLKGSNVIEWSWDGIAEMVQKLTSSEPSTSRKTLNLKNSLISREKLSRILSKIGVIQNNPMFISRVSSLHKDLHKRSIMSGYKPVSVSSYRKRDGTFVRSYRRKRLDIDIDK